MNPYPFALLNHLTLPVIRIVLFLACWWHCHQNFRTKKKAAHAAFLGSRKAGPQRDNTGRFVLMSTNATRNFPVLTASGVALLRD
jgi:hypothetical protein